MPSYVRAGIRKCARIRALSSYEKRSVVFTTNLEFGRWGEVFGDGDMAAAVIDRIVHHGRIVRFRGESYRNSHSLMK